MRIRSPPVRSAPAVVAAAAAAVKAPFLLWRGGGGHGELAVPTNTLRQAATAARPVYPPPPALPPLPVLLAFPGTPAARVDAPPPPWTRSPLPRQPQVPATTGTPSKSLPSPLPSTTLSPPPPPRATSATAAFERTPFHILPPALRTATMPTLAPRPCPRPTLARARPPRPLADVLADVDLLRARVMDLGTGVLRGGLRDFTWGLEPSAGLVGEAEAREQVLAELEDVCDGLRREVGQLVVIGFEMRRSTRARGGGGGGGGGGGCEAKQ
ncbi:hypothetical protein DFJ73DRAFT_960435 [Zopfochytrium polystomum]|nr:hypothetical protein DFJ73DRAFT_960435 [Zopfochytrium polystomum]